MKTSVNQLAILGGSPAFSVPLHVGRPNIGDRERLLARINDLLDRRWLSNNGPFVLEFEQRVAEMLDVRHCVAMCNGTVALEVAIRAAGLHGEVIVPSFTFAATAHALRWQGIQPVFCDVDPRTHNIDPASVLQRITPRTTGIIGVHLWGRACPVEALQEIADDHGLTLLFDAAHAFGCTHRGRMIGGFGAAEAFSFHATKFFNTFEGGAVTTNDDDLAERLRLMRNFGFAGYDQVISVGTNGKMSEVAAAMGLTGLESMERFIAANRRNYACYRQGLADIPGLRLIDYPAGERSNYQYVIVEVDEEQTGLSRDMLVEMLTAENVLARRYFAPGCHRMSPYAEEDPAADADLPHTLDLAERVLALPTGTSVRPQDVAEVCGLLRLAVANGTWIAQALHGQLVAVAAH